VIELTPQQIELQRAAEEFARAELGILLSERDRDERLDRRGWTRCAEFGLMRMPVPETHGGLGMGLTDLIAVMEGLGYGTADHGLLFAIHAHLWTNVMPILTFGTDDQRARYLPRLLSGEWIGANGASEPDAGSDIFSMRTRAVRDGDHYVLNGTKTFVTNAQDANVFVVYATLDRSLGPTGITSFIIDAGTPGLTVGRPLQKMGMRTSSMAEVILEDCKVDVTNRLGREGRGAAVFDSSMEWERGCILAGSLGAMRRHLESCISHAKGRKQFGQSIGKFQSVANRIVDMKVRLDTCRPLVYRIGQLKDRGQTARIEAATAKLHVSESFVASAFDAMRVFGSYGYMTEQGLERELRDAIGGVFYSGTSDIQRNIIAKGLGL
jgi:alkylation response protein AidB-like acyl-CoA dehydrogenase